jgi:hypothetical protein
MKLRTTGLRVVLGLVLMAVVPSVSDALAKSVKVEGSGSYAHITPNFTYDGSPAIELRAKVKITSAVRSSSKG